MKRRGLQLSRRHRSSLYAAGLILFISGLSWAWIQHLDQAGQAPDSARRWKTCLIAVHGWAAMLFVLLLGTILASHVRRGWHARKNRSNGGFFLFALAVLTLSGYALYYTADDKTRALTSNLHLWLGITAPILLIVHIRTGRRATM